MRKIAGVLVLIFVSYKGIGQYYFNDILANEQSNKLYVSLKAKKIKKISVKNFDAQGNASVGFSLEQIFDDNWNSLTTHSSTITGSTSHLITTYRNNKISSTDEMTKGVQIKNKYLYDEKGRLQSISSTTKDTAFKYEVSEKHIWLYTDDQPKLMYKIKNTIDTTTIEFVRDEKNNIAEEHWKYKGKELEVYYYYYNAQNRVTDIVRFNQRAQKLLPDFIFDFDEAGRVSQLTQIPVGSSNYIVWKYVYNNNGLKQTELCYNKQKELIGKVEYVYE